ncbi:MAG: PIG-L family deacetylase, partial [Acidobacteria bacterium]|nr:PIG-L family deacetylase [Acidobacteriota bacterium]
MKRRDFVEKTLVGGALLGAGSHFGFGDGAAAPDDTSTQGGATGDGVTGQREVVVERSVEGQPHKGKVLAAIQPHCDDIPLFAGGTVAKLLKEGYTGYLLRTTNDEKAGVGATLGESIVNDERDTEKVGEVYGMKKVYNLYYRNHQLDNYDIQELKARLIFLFRLLKVDTIVSFDPWGHYEENPDHYVTARAVEAARWMAGNSRNYPEHFDAGVAPHSVREQYYYARGPQLVNRVVDITDVIDVKVAVNRVNVTQGPAGENGSRLRARLASEKKRLAILGDDDET